MLFNSIEYIFIFIPVVFIGYFLLNKIKLYQAAKVFFDNRITVFLRKLQNRIRRHHRFDDFVKLCDKQNFYKKYSTPVEKTYLVLGNCRKHIDFIQFQVF